MHITTLCH